VVTTTNKIASQKAVYGRRRTGEKLFRFRAHGLGAVYDVEMKPNFSKKRQSFTISSDREAMR